jgi:hypothetical protein
MKVQFLDQAHKIIQLLQREKQYNTESNPMSPKITQNLFFLSEDEISTLLQLSVVLGDESVYESIYDLFKERNSLASQRRKALFMVHHSDIQQLIFTSEGSIASKQTRDCRTNIFTSACAPFIQ